MTTSTDTHTTLVDAASEPQDAASTTSAFTEVESEVLRWLAIMPFLAQRELEALAEWSDTAVYYALRGLGRRRLAAGQPVSTPWTATACRWFLTPSGVEAVATITNVPLNKTLTARPGSAHWVRLLAERMDAVAPFYRLVSELAGVTGIRGFHWYRGHPLDALVQLEEAGCWGSCERGGRPCPHTWASASGPHAEASGPTPSSSWPRLPAPPGLDAHDGAGSHRGLPRPGRGLDAGRR